MKDYIKKTLDEINAEISVLADLRDGIESHFGKDAGEQQDALVSRPVRQAEKRGSKKVIRKPGKKVKEKDLESAGENEGPVRIGSLQHKALVEARKF